MLYEPVIGLEIHTQLKTQSKMFCSCKNTEADEPNTNVCPICMGHPGTLPAVNEKAIQLGILASLALNAEVCPECKFDRKHYFYPDLPKGYQISQYDEPLALGGYVMLDELGRKQKIELERLHLEEDAAKSIHTSDGKTLIDFNRAGAPLMEIVTKPVMNSWQEVKLFAQELRTMLIYVGATEGNLKKGQMRFDVNVSLREQGTAKLGNKVEIKNINSFKSLEGVIQYEIQRQEALLRGGKEVVTETRGWNDESGETVAHREKEGSDDYRYFPESDIPPLQFTEDEIERCRRKLPEMPYERRMRFKDEYELSYHDAEFLTNEPGLGDFFEKTMSELESWINSLDSTEGSDEQIWRANRKKLTKLVLGWLTSELLKLMNIDGKSIHEIKIIPENFAEFLTLLYENRINSTAGQMILAAMYKTGIDPSQAMQEMNLEQVNDVSTLETAVTEIIAEEQKVVGDYLGGRDQALMYLVGKVMKKMQGKANPQIVTDILREKLGSPKK